MSFEANIYVKIDANTNVWKFSSQDLPVNINTGAMFLPPESPVTINYILIEQDVGNTQFCFANLSEKLAITAQISNINISEGQISITDLNSQGATGRNTFGIILYARRFDDINPTQLLKSPDPEVTNDPPTDCP